MSTKQQKRPWWKRSDKTRDKTKAKPTKKRDVNERKSREEKERISRTGNVNTVGD